MIPWLLSQLSEESSASRVLLFWNYISVRGAAALILAFLLSVAFGNRTIEYLRRLKVGQHVRDDQGADAISLKE
ncbi:hypothetical protein HZA57_07895, partial [Candidatus Poribacteria bacterium]|nr:hypothetical protein [Candidatus Poribacteria bacterium]